MGFLTFFTRKKRICNICGHEMVELFNGWICETCDDRQRAENRVAYLDKGPLPSILYASSCSGTMMPATGVVNNIPMCISGIIAYNNMQ